MLFTKTCGRVRRRRRAAPSPTAVPAAGRASPCAAKRRRARFRRACAMARPCASPGQGNAGRRGGAGRRSARDGAVEPHPLFRREGDDLHLDVPVAIHEAAFGAKIDVPSPTGACRVRVPPGTQSGQRFRLRERGVPSPRAGRPGDLIVTVRVVLPPLDDERSRALRARVGVRPTPTMSRKSAAGVSDAWPRRRRARPTT